MLLITKKTMEKNIRGIYKNKTYQIRIQIIFLSIFEGQGVSP